MAFYYSRRKLKPREKEEAGELNIVPYLDILMNLIIFMLMSITGLAAFGILNVNAPGYGAPSAAANPEEPNKPNYLLTVGISDKGFYVAATGGVLGQQNAEGAAQPGEGEPTIPKNADGTYNFEALTRQMVNIKGTPEFRTETKVILAAQDTVPYEVLISAMDAVRERPGNRADLFPDVTLGAF